MALVYNTFAKILSAARGSDFTDKYTYQDYLYELLADGCDERSAAECQCETICDMQGSRKLMYASSIIYDQRQ